MDHSGNVVLVDVAWDGTPIASPYKEQGKGQVCCSSVKISLCKIEDMLDKVHLL